MSSIEKYIHEANQEQQPKLNEIYQLIKEIVPVETTEKISYGLPTFYLKGNLVHFGGMKNHLGFYPAPSAMEAFSEELTDYKILQRGGAIPVWSRIANGSHHGHGAFSFEGGGGET